MKVTVFTSNQPRHLALIKELSLVCEHVYVIQECSTIFPGRVADHYSKSPLMQQYFDCVIRAEENIFGQVDFLNSNVSQLCIKYDDLNKMNLSLFSKALNSDLYVVFGASFIKGELIDFLCEKKCLNIHMGLSPFYRGSSTNFWALFDERPEMVGATIHYLSKGVDDGDILFHALPSTENVNDPFDFGMRAVLAAHKGLVHFIKNNGDKTKWVAFQQSIKDEMRYCRNKDFNDTVVDDYLKRLLSVAKIKDLIDSRRNLKQFINPFVI